jgi:hypothetical protein
MPSVCEFLQKIFHSIEFDGYIWNLFCPQRTGTFLVCNKDWEDKGKGETVDDV